MVSLKNERGSLLIPFLLLTLITVTTGFGIWGVMRAYRHRVEHQLQLDKCVGMKALELKSILSKLDASNTRMTWVRRAAVVGIYAHSALAAIRAELMVELALQEGLRAKWIAEGLIAEAGGGCSDIKARPLRYPMLAWTRLPADEIGPQPFDWVDESPKFDLLYLALPLHSAAEVLQGNENEDDWVSKWTDFY